MWARNSHQWDSSSSQAPRSSHLAKHNCCHPRCWHFDTCSNCQIFPPMYGNQTAMGHVLRSSGEHSYADTHHTSTVASRKLHPIISPWSWILASYDRGGSQRVPRKGSAQNWPGRLSMTVIAGSVVDDLPSGTRDDTHRASLCFHECIWGILIFVLLLSLSLPRSPSLPLPPRWLHHDMPASGTASTITASGSRF